jgi:hypothetical protein
MDADLERIAHIAENGLQRSREAGEEDTDLRLDNFAIVGVWAWKDEDGNECEGYSVWSETRRNHVQLGILHGGLSRLAEGGGSN